MRRKRRKSEEQKARNQCGVQQENTGGRDVEEQKEVLVANRKEEEAGGRSGEQRTECRRW